MSVRSLFSALPQALLLGLAIACGSGSAEAPATQASAEAATAKAATPVKAEPDAGGNRAQRKERPLPAFSGRTLDGQPFSIADELGQRIVLVFFNPEIPDSEVVAKAVGRIAPLAGDHNFRVIGVATGSNPIRVESFVEDQGIDYTIVDDSSARIARRLGLRAPIAMLGVDADGYVTWGFAQLPTDLPKADEVIEGQLRTALRLPESDEEAVPGSRPKAPLFEARILDDPEPFKLAEALGKPIMLVFFLHTCPHCHELLGYVKAQLQGMPEDQRPLLLGLEVTGKTHAVRERMKEDGLDFFPILFDDAGTIRDDYGVFAGVPDTVLIDKQGRIAARMQGWRETADGPLLRMRLAKLAGAPVPMLLRPTGYTGNEACGVCHEAEHQSWQITQHATAYGTLIKHGADSDTECVGCHVVGFEQAGGFELGARPAELENVGCESCHGRGGPHLSPSFVTANDYEPVCITCHDKKHSLGFEYASFSHEVSHTANTAILALPAAERDAILAKRGQVRTNLLPTTADYVGSEACASCHADEHATWAANPHAKALASLEAKGEASNADCLKCHTTAFGKTGGFPASAAVADHPDLARVGCESCHGPGGDHVAEGATKLGTIVSLGDKCDSCVILQICGSCHDDANDPGFHFVVQEKIDKLRHGTIEAGTGKPKSKDQKMTFVRPERPRASLEHDLARAFALADAHAETPRWTAN